LQIFTAPEALAVTTNAFREDRYKIGMSEMTYIPLPEYELSIEESSDEAKRANETINQLELESDVVAVHSNFISEA
jgi:transcriptional/translational regulatory protein YebC/TACO1